jgi:anaerobic selenocysteine-containing dehydrogenase
MSDLTHYRNCHLCEAMCGIEIKTSGETVVSIRGDSQDPFSNGYICPKATALKDLHEDPNRLRSPVKRVGQDWIEISWDEAFELVSDRLLGIRKEHGNDSFGVYLGNPAAHNYGIMIHGIPLIKLLKTKNRFSASSVDQFPHMLVAYWMYGHQFLVPIPDIDRTDHFLILGANPLASNGSLMTVPNVRGRLGEVKKRGKVVVIDPRKSETAQFASEHHFIRPGRDAAFLSAVLNTVFEEELVDLKHLGNLVKNLGPVKDLIKGCSPEMAEGPTGISAVDIRTIARDFANAKKAVCYGRMGVSTQAFGTLCQWLIQVLNIVTGNLDAEGGLLFTLPAFDIVGSPESRKGHRGLWSSRVSGFPEVHGELPAASMAEEILTEGEGQIRTMLTVAGNPVLSTPNGRQLEEALGKLEFMVSIDPYINETTRFADVILPPGSALEHENFDMVFPIFAVRNTVKYSPATLPKGEKNLADWEIMRRLAVKIAEKQGLNPGPEFTPDQVVDMALRAGPYGYKHQLNLSLKTLKKHPHGLDLGALKPCLPGRLQSADSKIELLPPGINEDFARMQSSLQEAHDSQLLLIGRRHLRSNNSWLHNSERLIKGEDRCTLLVNPSDLKRHSLTDGQMVTVRSRVGKLSVRAVASQEMMPGVISLPHGFGHDREGSKLDVAARRPGVSVNDLTDEKLMDPLSGNAAVNGVPVSIGAS